MNPELEALTRIPTDFAAAPDDIWDNNARPHVKGINDEAFEAIRQRINVAAQSQRTSALGLPIVGHGGTGKTHQLGMARQQVQLAGGYFVHLRILRVDDFWANLVSGFLDALNRQHESGKTGLEHLLTSLANQTSLDKKTYQEIIVDRKPTAGNVRAFINALMALDRETASVTRHTLRALLLLFADDLELSDIGDIYLGGGKFDEDKVFSSAQPEPKSDRERARDLSYLLALTGPTLIALDQIDEIVQSTHRSTGSASDATNSSKLLDMLGNGLSELRDLTRRSAVILSCLPHVWEDFCHNVTGTAVQRFDEPTELRPVLPNAEAAAHLLSAVFAPAYQEVGFTPPYPSYPFPLDSLRAASHYSPRELLNQARQWIRSCIAAESVTEATSLDSTAEKPATPLKVDKQELLDLDDEYARHQSEVDISPALDPYREDLFVPNLLRAALEAWAVENGWTKCEVRRASGAKASAHAELEYFPSDGGSKERYAFRAIATTNGRAAGNRVDKLYDIAGFGQTSPIERSHGILWVTAPPEKWGRWSPQSKVAEYIANFDAEGMIVMADHHDLRDFFALHLMRSRQPQSWNEWLLSRQPASQSKLLTAVFGGPSFGTGREPGPTEPDSGPSEPPVPTLPLDLPGEPSEPGSVADRRTSEHPPLADDSIVFGQREDGSQLGGDLATLAKHTTVFAGTGSGKTVLIKRIIESCAMQGVSAIVLDPNNDLSQLGQPWPEPPSNWLPDDSLAADQYFEAAEVVVWTPGRSAGRPLSFQPLPDLRSVADSPDDFEIALDTVVASLSPRARVDGTTAKAERQRAILREALRSFVDVGGWQFRDFLDYLEQLPSEASSFSSAPAVASDIASTLRAVQVNDRVFAGNSENVDPSVLLTPSDGKKARVSVVNFMGLPSKEQKQSFVNQLQMTLFSWLKDNPSTGRQLGSLLVMDEAPEFVPSDRATPCTASTLALVSQARKYGLGMVFATQSPKGIHNRIVGNSATHIYGKLNAPVQVAAANAIAENQSGIAVDVARLSPGRFYISAPGESTQLLVAPMCLSYHPPTAPSNEEILASIAVTAKAEE